MKPKDMKELFIEVVKIVQNKYHFELISYLILDNNFHLIIRTLDQGETISKIMQLIKSMYAKRYNKIKNRKGAFWNERFTDEIIEYVPNPRSYFLDLQCLLGKLPIDDKKVTNPVDYEFSSINVYLKEGHSPPLDITLHKYFLELGDNLEDSIASFIEYFKKYLNVRGIDLSLS
jgi:REP element-mobilizing transposase RayT